MDTQNFDLLIVGSGMAGLTAGAMATKHGLSVGVLEQNWLPGGCTSSYWRKGFVFESGATTLVGLDPNMPLQHVLEQTGIKIETIKLGLPMKVHLRDGSVLNRYEPLEDWIVEAERVFGKQGQRPFWEFCYKISQFVWNTSIKQLAFPPSSFKDLMVAASNVTVDQLKYARYALKSMESLLKDYGLLKNKRFIEFVDEQLLITAQNHHGEVNVLFGCAALCYTNYSNYYVPGGLINLVKPFSDYIEANNGKVLLRHEVQKINKSGGGYQVAATYKKESLQFRSKYLISAIPINNTLPLFEEQKPKFERKVMGSEYLNSAFQMGIGFKSDKHFETIHHQIHLDEPLVSVGSASIFISLSHHSDTSRADEPNQKVASISTHVADPNSNFIDEPEQVEEAIVKVMEKKGFLRKEDIVYQHSSTPKSWQKWTNREWGFVGGYPQYMRIKPWQMLDARFDKQGAYLCGDSTYPGQGIPGATLSGLIAFNKLKMDYL